MPAIENSKPGTRTLAVLIAALSMAVTMPGQTRRLVADGDGGTPASATFVRRNIYSPAIDQKYVDCLRGGVKVMMSRPATDQNSWIYQANMHYTYDAPVQPLWNGCQHGNWYFLPWHRMYLMYFERILRQAVQESGVQGCRADFSVPYWNYTPTEWRQLPPAFRVPADSSVNPLYASQRSAVNSGATMQDAQVDFLLAYSRIPFFAMDSPFSSSLGGGLEERGTPQDAPYGQLERLPHNIIHVLIGGTNPAGLMTDPATAARDPIFWLHHANIDRLWAGWVQKGGGRANPLDNSTWMSQPFDFFDENRRKVTLTVAQVENYDKMDYSYDDTPHSPAPPNVLLMTEAPQQTPAPRAAAAKPPVTLAATTQAVDLGAATVKVNVTLPRPANRLFGPAVARAGAAAPPTILLKLEDIQYEGARGEAYEVYVNLPEGEKPDYRGPYFVGNLEFFSKKVAHHANAAAGIGETYDITGVIRNLQRQNKLSDARITVTIVPIALVPAAGQPQPQPATPPAPPIKVGRISIVQK